MKILIEEKDETQDYRIVPIKQFIAMIKEKEDRYEIRVPNLCGGETRITIFKSTCPEGNVENIELLKNKEVEK